jgi:hypothetical protein
VRKARRSSVTTYVAANSNRFRASNFTPTLLIFMSANCFDVARFRISLNIPLSYPSKTKLSHGLIGLRKLRKDEWDVGYLYKLLSLLSPLHIEEVASIFHTSLSNDSIITLSSPPLPLEVSTFHIIY